MAKVLYITYDGLTDPLGQSQVLPYLVELSKESFHFTIISFEKKERFESERSIVQPILDRSAINWFPLSFTARPPIVSKIYDRWKLQRAVRKVCRKQKFDIVHCRSYVAAEAGLRAKEKFGIKFLFDMRGFWADERVDNGQWNQANFFFRLVYRHYKKKEKEFLLNADSVITLTASAKRFLISKPEYRSLPIEVVPCCADFSHFDYHAVEALEVAAVMLRLGIPANARVITYLGSVGGWYLTREMFSFFRTVSQNKPEYVMLFLTKDSPEQVKAEASAIGISPEKIFVRYANRNQLPHVMALSTMGIFFIRNSFSKIASSPTKHGELMAMGIPVICNDIGDTGDIVNRTRTGIVVGDFSEGSYIDALNKMNEIEQIDKQYIRDCGLKIFSLDKGVQTYLSVYNKLMN